MSTADLTPQFTDETAAREHLEALRWPNGVFCPHCGSFEGITKMQGKSHRPGLFLCGACRGNFSVTVGTVYERSHIPLHKWLLATHLMASSKKGISAHQLHRMLGITYKSAWIMAHRIREAMKDTSAEPMGGPGQYVEADETYIGKKANMRKTKAYHHKMAVVSLVERGGKARSFHVARTTSKNIAPIVAKHVNIESTLNIDEAEHYRTIGRDFAVHQSVFHGRREYVKGTASTNTIEGFYSIFKRGMKGVYQHCSEAHLQRYLTEFDFRYSNRAKLGVTDKERAEKALKGIEGKRLTYRRTDKRPEAPSLG
jgi:transposase-like protein